MARQSNTEVRREEIALALARVMVRTGYDRATVGAIADEAGVATGSVHYHFESKSEILLDLVGRTVEAAERRTAARVARARGPREELTALLDGLLDTGPGSDADAVRVWALIGGEAARNAEVGRLYEGWVVRARARLRGAFVAACRSESRSARGAMRSASALVALVEGYFTVGAGAPAAVPAGSAAPTARRIAHALIDGQPQVSP